MPVDVETMQETVPRVSKSHDLFSSPQKRTVILSLLLVLATLALYNPVSHNGFINVDDNLYVTNNKHVQSGLSWRTVKWSFTTFDQANWHPLTWISFLADWQLFERNAGGYHYVSLLFHAFDAVLLFWLLQTATGFTWRSLMVATLFALHPINVESVAWISEVKNVTSMMFFLLAMIAYGWYARQPSRRRYWLVPLLFVIGLLAKPQIITLPCVLLLWDYWPLKRFGHGTGEQAGPYAKASFGALVIEKLPLFLLAGLDALITMLAQRHGMAVRTFTEYSLYARLGNAIVSYARYVGQAFWPFRLSPCYGHPGDSIPVWQVVAASVFLIVVTVAILLRRKPYLTVGWLWFLGTMFPTIGVIQAGDQAMANRYAYIPFIGLFWMATWAVSEVADKRQISPRWLAVPACLSLLTASVMTYRMVNYWHDSETLWSYAVTINRNDFMAHQNLAGILVVENRIEQAITEFSMAERLHRYPDAEVLLFADFEIRNGHAEDAAALCRKVLQRTQDRHLRIVAWTDLGVANLTLNNVAEADKAFATARQIDPNSGGPIIGMGLLAMRAGDYNGAIEQFSSAIRMEPSDMGYYLMAVALEKSGRQAEANAAYAKVQQTPLTVR
jgi:protein O-mannosyl-transferase